MKQISKIRPPFIIVNDINVIAMSFIHARGYQGFVAEGTTQPLDG